MLFYFTIIKIKYLTTLTKLFFFTDFTHYAVLLSPLLKWNIWLRSLRCFSSLTTLTTLFYFTTIKMKYLTTLTTLFLLTDYTHYAVLLHYYQNEISDYAHYAVFLHWLHSLHCFNSLLLKRKFLTTLTTLFFFTDYTHYSILLH